MIANRRFDLNEGYKKVAEFFPGREIPEKYVKKYGPQLEAAGVINRADNHPRDIPATEVLESSAKKRGKSKENR